MTGSESRIKEHIPTHIFESSGEASKRVAKEIAELIRQKQRSKENCILGLATGSTPIKVYQELVRMHKEESLSFKNVHAFNLDEYYPMSNQGKRTKTEFDKEPFFFQIH